MGGYKSCCRYQYLHYSFRYKQSVITILDHISTLIVSCNLSISCVNFQIEPSILSSPVDNFQFFHMLYFVLADDENDKKIRKGVKHVENTL